MQTSAKKTKQFTLLGCALLGAALFVVVYGLHTLDVTYDAWLLNGYIETDSTQRYAGWLAYRAAPGLFPLTFSPLVSWPFGGYTSLCDSMPLLEVVFKLCSPLLPATFQFEGWVCLTNLMLQGLCGGLLVGLFTRDDICILLGGGLFCLSPVLLERIFRHTSLTFHWMLLLGFYCYWRTRRGRVRVGYGGLAALAVGGVWLHLYFTPMLLGLLAAAVLEAALRRERILWPALTLLGSGLLCLGSAAALGILGLGMANTNGYGTMGMNLNALFNPASLGAEWWVPGKGRLDWSLFLPMRATAENGLESFNYLGFGVLLGLLGAAVWALVRGRRSGAAVGRLVRGHPFLAAYAVFCTLFAISNVVCAFSYVLVRLPMPGWLQSVCSAFRASGRLFWGVYYLLVLGCLVFWLRHGPHKQGTVRAILLALLLVQSVDLAPCLLTKRAEMAAPASFTASAQVADVANLLDGRTVLYSLELRQDRALCAGLLKADVASNLWLISREGYGVEELTADMDKTYAALLAGENPYPQALYCTADAAKAETLSDCGTVTQLDNVWYLQVE